MDHPRAVFGKVHLPAGVQVPMLRGRPLSDGKLQVGVGLSAATQKREGLLNHYVTFELQTSGYAEAKYQSFIQTMKVVLRRGYAGSRWDFARSHVTKIPDMIYLLSPKELMPHFLYRAFVAARDAIPRRPAPKTFVAVYFCEQPPDPASRVTLSEETDRLGMNKLNLHWHLGDSVKQGVFRMQELLRQELERTGMGRLETSQDGSGLHGCLASHGHHADERQPTRRRRGHRLSRPRSRQPVPGGQLGVSVCRSRESNPDPGRVGSSARGHLRDRGLRPRVSCITEWRPSWTTRASCNNCQVIFF